MANKNLMVTINTGKKEVVKELRPITINYALKDGGYAPVSGWEISEDVSVFEIVNRGEDGKEHKKYRLVLTKCGYYVNKKNGGDYSSIEGAVKYGHRHALHVRNEDLAKYEKECKRLEKALAKPKKAVKKTASKGKKVAKKSTK